MCVEPRKHLEYLRVRTLYNQVFDFDQPEYEILLWQAQKIHEFGNKKNMVEVIAQFASVKSIYELTKLFYLSIAFNSAEAERSFSVLKRLKTWLRNTIGQTRLSD